VAAGAPVAGALAGATRDALRLADVLEEMLSGLPEALANPNRRRIEETKALDDRLDHLNRAIKENLLAIDTARLNVADNEKLARILTFSINLEKAGDLIDPRAARRRQSPDQAGLGLLSERHGESALAGQSARGHAASIDGGVPERRCRRGARAGGGEGRFPPAGASVSHI
jgi:hypothetical protein